LRFLTRQSAVTAKAAVQTAWVVLAHAVGRHGRYGAPQYQLLLLLLMMMMTTMTYGDAGMTLSGDQSLPTRPQGTSFVRFQRRPQP